MPKLVLLIALFLGAGPLQAQSQLRWGLGVGMETRLQKEVNPEFADFKAIGNLFQELRLGPWSVLGELGIERNDSGTGGLRIGTESIGVQAWGRYHFMEPEVWSPFLALGGGMYFDRVTSQFHDLKDVRHGQRLMTGAGAGISNVFWHYLLVEGEVRGLLLEGLREPGVSFILRAGLQL